MDTRPPRTQPGALQRPVSFLEDAGASDTPFPRWSVVEAMIILIAAILAFPAPWKHKLIGLALGFVAIQSLNLVRIISLFYIGQWNYAVIGMSNFGKTLLVLSNQFGYLMLPVIATALLWLAMNLDFVRSLQNEKST